MRRDRVAKLASVDLTDLVTRGMSGEFICASSAIEVHVHLQAGRVAWATDSRHAFVFTRHLQENAALPKEQFREVLDECRRNHLPLGETLVAWGLATLDQVRAALQHQISCALTELSKLDQGRSVFLERARGYQQYASELTFDLADFREELANDGPPLSSSSAASRGLVHEIREAVSDVTWIELLDGEEVVDQDPPGSGPLVPRSVLELTLQDGAKLVTVRSPRGTLVGVSLHGRRTLWCRVAVDSTFGSAVAALSAIGGFDSPAPPTPRDGARGGSRWTTGDTRSSAVRELSDFLGRAPDLVASLVAAPLGSDVIHGAGEPQIALDWCRDIVRRRAPVFGLAKEVFSEIEPPSTDLEGLGFRFQSLATAEAEFWCFGAEVSAPVGGSAWIFVKRSASQGVGWAYLSALTRRLEALPDWGAHGQ